ncbi:MAG TPA: 4Fe-4S dicluster domain-containing protein [Candidatus Scatomonas merdigallinarum]|nr:4Fe-4S dicluster domain-containing protein [Candidatus Scatomonas merdigallinarum]
MEKKEEVYLGKHYRMKQAFGQEELHQREAVCTREEPPGCQAACPLHLDMRAVCGHEARGDFKKAAAVIRQTTPFLYLLARTCSAPCQKACTLSRLGEGVRVRDLELACALYGGPAGGSRFLIPRKNKKVLVAGDGIFALACCRELGKKGYEVHWHTACASFQAPLLELGLSPEEAAADLSEFSTLRITREAAEKFFGETLEDWSRRADAFCVSPELVFGRLPENGFTGPAGKETVWILAAARYAAMQADRYLQGASPEGLEEPKVYESRLHVTLDGITGSRAVTGQGALTREMAAEEAARCIQCQCLECVKGCVYLQEFKRNPRGAIREIYNNLSIVMGNHMANGLINACDECGQCKAACPEGFDYPDVCRIARRTMVETGKMPPSAHEFALLDQEFSNGEAFLARPQPGYETCRYLFFPGCQAAAVSPRTVEITYRRLREELEGGTGLLLGCCGAISRWAAREELLQEALEKIRAAWESMGRPEILCACPTCLKNLRELTSLPARGVWEVLLELGTEPVTDQRVSIHDACGAREDGEIRAQIRRFAEALGCRVEEMPFAGELSPCCGYGGLVRYANPRMAEKKAVFASGRSEHRILTYCMACRDQFQRAGKDSIHILELACQVEPGPVPDLSLRRANRLKLKEKLQRELWKEEGRMEEMLPVIYMEGAREEMDQRMILESDVNAVLKAYESSGEAVEDPEKGWLAASLRLGNVTFWVKFTDTEGCYRVYGAYSHRMTVE